MNTVQRYTGKGNNVSPTSQTAKNAEQAPSAQDARLFTTPYFESLNPEIYEMQCGILEAVDSFLQSKSAAPAINQLLEHWLKTSNVDLSDKDDQYTLTRILRVVDFLIEIKSLNDDLWFSVEHYNSQKGGQASE